MHDNTGNTDDRQELASINAKIGEAERKKDGKEIRDYLSDDLIFLRGNGTIATKDDYLGGLESAANTNEHLSWDVPQVFLRNEHALVVVNVTLRGKRGDNAVDGVFRNYRTFMKQGGSWKLVTWANYKTLDNLT